MDELTSLVLNFNFVSCNHFTVEIGLKPFECDLCAQVFRGANWGLVGLASCLDAGLLGPGAPAVDVLCSQFEQICFSASNVTRQKETSHYSAWHRTVKILPVAVVQPLQVIARD